MSGFRTRFWLEAGTAISSGLLAVLTLFWRDWIEVTGWDPDQHSGAAEWLLVAVLAVVSVTTSVVARAEWRRPRLATT